MPEDFHWTFALILCRTAFHDCDNTSRRKEFVVSVGVVRKLARYAAIPFATAADEFQDGADDSPTLLLVRLHWHSRLFPDLYFDRYHQHFTVMHDSGMPFNVSHPQRFVGALLHNAFPVRDKPSPKAKLPPAFLDHPTKFPIDSCVQEYRDWTTDCEDWSSPDEHFVWLSYEFMPFQTNLGNLYVPLRFYPRVARCWRLAETDRGGSLGPGPCLSTLGWPYNLTTNPPVPAQGMRGGKEERRKSTIGLRSKNLR